MKLTLALQGGGAHGAFTWGVLDKLLEAGLQPEAISGTSAGAMNAVMLAEGWRVGGVDGARDLLQQFWLGLALPDSFAAQKPVDWWRKLTKHLSPYDLNPFDYNPLKELLEKLIDFEALRVSSPIHLYIAATQVDTGGLRLFRETELGVEHMLASACLPTLHKAVEIEGKHYWDGGFSGNPVLRPLIIDSTASNLLCVLLQPLIRPELPTQSNAITERMNELMFQSAFMRELELVKDNQTHLKRYPWLLGKQESRWRKCRMHLIEPDDILASMDAASRFDTRKGFLESLYQQGYAQAEHWIEKSKGQLGRSSTWKIEALFAR